MLYKETEELIEELKEYDQGVLIDEIKGNPLVPIIIVRGGVVVDTIGIRSYILVDWDNIKGC